jgi:hypothetical protein
MPSRSRKTHSKGMSGGASTVWDLPLISNVIMIDLPTHPEKWSISTRPMYSITEVIRRKQVVATLAAGPRMTSPDESHGRQGKSQPSPAQRSPCSPSMDDRRHESAVSPERAPSRS